MRRAWQIRGCKDVYWNTYTQFFEHKHSAPASAVCL
jgi:hypothetical protein